MFIRLTRVSVNLLDYRRPRTIISTFTGVPFSRSMASVKVPRFGALSDGNDKSGDQSTTTICDNAHQQELIIDMNSDKKNTDDSYNYNYERTILDLNSLQSNAKTISLAKYKSPQDIIPLFEHQLNLAGIRIEDLNRLNIIHISGTKGKGSSCAFVESILRAHGLKTGFYNSPHLINVTERIRINGLQIDDELFCKYFREIFDRLEEGTQRENISMPTYFSFLTILAFHIFIGEKVDCAVVEVGIGGEYDPTNILQRPIACGISAIHFDHINILGDSIESIAWSKAGIAKKNVPIFTVDQEHKSSLEVIKSRALEKSCPVYICEALRGPPDIRLGIKGSAQRTNASLAVQISKYFLACYKGEQEHKIENVPGAQILETNFSELGDKFQEALANCSWSGRCQIIKYPNKRLTFFLDGAHTKESMDNCIEWFQQTSEQEDKHASKILMVNIIGERNKGEILRPLCRNCIFDEAIFSTNRTGANNPRSETYAKDNSDKGIENVRYNASTWINLLQEYKIENRNLRTVSNILEGMDHLMELSKLNPCKSYHVLATGSLHFVGAMLETLPSDISQPN